MRGPIQLAIAGSLIGSATAQRPTNVSICDYYANALFNVSNATTQYTLLTALVNTAVIGNYTQPNLLAVPGILNPKATYNGTKVNLAQYFDGSLYSTNTGGDHGASVNFLEPEGARALAQSKPGNDKKSKQYKLLTHLYSYFGSLLACSNMNTPAFPSYAGELSMYEVHKFMALDAYEVQYFIQQVGLAAASFGVAMADVQAVGHLLQDFFGYKCLPETGEGVLPSICIDADCPEAPTNPKCSAYAKVEEPKAAKGSGGASNMNGTAMPGGKGDSGAATLYVSLVTLSMMMVGVYGLLG